MWASVRFNISLIKTKPSNIFLVISILYPHCTHTNQMSFFSVFFFTCKQISFWIWKALSHILCVLWGLLRYKLGVKSWTNPLKKPCYIFSPSINPTINNIIFCYPVVYSQFHVTCHLLTLPGTVSWSIFFYISSK